MKSLKTTILLAGAALAVALGCGAQAQIVTLPQVSTINSTDLFQDIPTGNAGSLNVYASMANIRSWVLGQGIHTTAPTLTTTTSICGGSAATVNGTDLSGVVTEAASASTSCVITFATPFITAPECFVSLNNVADTALKCATTTTAATVTQTSASSNVLNYLIVAQPGG